nr:sel1 repeat family protein [uncultured Pseudomonas sp.]
MDTKPLNKIHSLIAVVCLAVAGLSDTCYAESDQALIRSAIATFEQRKPDLLMLRKAAEIGDYEAQFYLAETLRLSSGHMTPEALSWYEKSAMQGDMYSMYRLSKISYDACAIMENCPANAALQKTWGQTLREVAQKKAQRGDGEAMEMMYTITGDLDWLKSSAATGYPSAQNWLAVRYNWGDGWFLWPGQREKEIERLYEASAEGGYPRAISQHAGNLLLKGNIEDAQKWLMKGVKVSHAAAVGAYAYNLEHGKYYHFSADLQLAYALNLLLSEIGGGARNAAVYSLEDLKPQLSPEQITSAIQQAKRWKETHPPISYHPPKLEFW